MSPCQEGNQEEVTEQPPLDDTPVIENIVTVHAATTAPKVPITAQLIVREDANHFLVGMEHLLIKKEFSSFQELFLAQNFSYNNLLYQACLVICKAWFSGTNTGGYPWPGDLDTSII